MRSSGPVTATTSGGKPRGPVPAQGQGASARARLAAERERERKARRRRQLLLVGVPVGVVVVALLALVVVRLTSSGSSGAASAGAASDPVIRGVTSVPLSVFDTVGAGAILNPPQKIKGPPLTQDGKPRVLYVGAEYCPYCAAERWAVGVALSRFGTFHGLGQTVSSTDVGEPYPGTATLTFHGSSFNSSTVAFTGVETMTTQKTALDPLSPADEQLQATYDAPPYVPADSKGSIPFVDIGGKYLVSGASFEAAVLQGKTHEQIAAALSDPTSPIAQAVDGTANALTAAICASTGNAPTSVCTSAGVTAAAKKLP